jgi:hypothetical protein
MPFTTLSAVVQANPASINSSLEKLSCSAVGIDEVDIYPAVLSALTVKGAPRGVVEEARVFLQAARRTRALKSHDNGKTSATVSVSATASLEWGTSSSSKEHSYMESFNVGIAMTLHTVLLSHNRIRNLLGIVQFKHCVRLSLLGNRIRTLEDCEPLALLSDLQYLSLEFNPVTQLPHYRAHLLRICAWPHELSTRTCRLRKLDGAAVTSAEIKHAVLCIQREQAFLPELLYRMQLLAFLEDVEKRQGVHRELRQRGFVLQQPAESVCLETTLERGAAYALGRVPVSGAAHLVRLLVRDRHQLMPAQLSPQRPNCGGKAFSSSSTRTQALSSRPASKQKTHAAEGEAAGVNSSATATFFGSDQPDTSNITRVSSLASCSCVADQTEGEEQTVHSLSGLLSTKELDWSRTALCRADAVAAKDTCREWSRDAFRQALTFLDVRICAALLRVARGLGQSLTAHDVDRLCQVWLHAVTHQVPQEGSAFNATGPRRVVIPRQATTAASQRATPVAQVRRKGGTECASASQSLKECSGGKEVAHLGGRGANSDERQPQTPLVTRLPVEATPQAGAKNVWVVGDQDGCLSASLSSSPVVSSEITDACTDISMTSLSTESLIQPRKAIPLPTAPSSLLTRRQALTTPQPTARSTPSTSFTPVSPPAATTKKKDAPLANTAMSTAAEKVFQRHAKRRAFQQWCTSLRHRWQSRIAAAYIQDKVSKAAAVQQPARCLRSPSWSGLLRHVTYIERKRGYFNCWRRRVQLKQEARSRELERVSQAWRTQSVELSLRSSQCTHTDEEAEHANSRAAGARLRTIKTAFQMWKSKAEQRALERCATARQRILAKTPPTPETFLSLRQQSPIARAVLSSTSPSPLAGVPRPLLDDLLATTEEPSRASSPLSTSSPAMSGYLRRFSLRAPMSVKVTAWRASTTSPVSVNNKDDSAVKELDSEASLSPVAPSSSDGISVNSATTPFLFDPRQAHTATAREADAVSSGSHDGTHDHLLHQPHPPLTWRELSPPPAIRILFPTEAAVGSHSPSSQTLPPPPLQAPVRAICAGGRSAAWLYGGTQPSRLPSTTAARRTIVQRSSPSLSAASCDPLRDVLAPHGYASMQRASHRSEVASPYREGDVEALVARAKQLEADRVFLLSEVRKLSQMRDHQRDASTQPQEPPLSPHTSRAGAASSPSVLDGTESRCAAQQREIQRLESIVHALRDERRDLLKSMKADLFQY